MLWGAQDPQVTAMGWGWQQWGRYGVGPVGLLGGWGGEGQRGGGEGGAHGDSGAIVCPGGAASMGHNGALMKRFVKIQSHVPTVRPPPPMPPSPLPPPPPFPCHRVPCPCPGTPTLPPDFGTAVGSLGLGAPWGWGLHGVGGSMGVAGGPWN